MLRERKKTEKSAIKVDEERTTANAEHSGKKRKRKRMRKRTGAQKRNLFAAGNSEIYERINGNTGKGRKQHADKEGPRLKWDGSQRRRATKVPQLAQRGNEGL